MSIWKVGDVVRPIYGGDRARETVVYVGDGFVVTIWETRSGIRATCRTDDCMEEFMEKVV